MSKPFEQKTCSSLDAFLEHLRRTHRLPGLAVAVVQDGRIAYLRGLGVAGLGRSMTPQTPLIIGSISKSLTALVVMQLVEAGKIDLDAPSNTSPGSASQTVTLQHISPFDTCLPTRAGSAATYVSSKSDIVDTFLEYLSFRLEVSN